MLATSPSDDDAGAVLFVDDEPTSRKWFARTFRDEFEVVTAAGVGEALEVLSERGDQFAVLVTDYRMPERDGMKLLQAVQRDYRHLVRVLATAYAGKEVAIAAVNEGKVLRILEKPLDDALTREALREAVALHRAQAFERAMNDGRAAAMRETLGFLAHELNTPLATVRGCVSAVAARCQTPAQGAPAGMVQFIGKLPGGTDGRAGTRRAARALLSIARLHIRAIRPRRLSRGRRHRPSAPAVWWPHCSMNSRSRKMSAPASAATCWKISGCRAGATCSTWCCAPWPKTPCRPCAAVHGPACASSWGRMQRHQASLGDGYVFRTMGRVSPLTCWPG